MPRASTPSQHEQLLAILKERDIEHTVDNSSKARRVKLTSRLTYNVPGTDLCFPLVGPTEFVFNADGSARSCNMNLKPAE